MLFFLLGCIKMPPAPQPAVRHYVHDSARDRWSQVDDLEAALGSILAGSTEAETLTVTDAPDGGWLVRAETRSEASDTFEWGEHHYSKDGDLVAYHHHRASYGWHCSSPMHERVDIDYTAAPAPSRAHTIELEAARDSDPECAEALEARRRAPDPGWEPAYREMSTVPVYLQIVRARELGG